MHGPKDGFPIERYTELVRSTLASVDVRFDDMVRYMEWVSEGFDHTFAVKGDEVVVTG